MALFGKPQYSTVTVKKKDIPKDLWTKCPKTGEIIYKAYTLSKGNPIRDTKEIVKEIPIVRRSPQRLLSIKFITTTIYLVCIQI